MIRAGIVGLSEGNGHPFSFSAIVNGYEEHLFERAGWPVILNYLRRQPANQFGITGVRVTHAWTQDPAQTRNLCGACHIDTACTNLESMLGEVDAVIIARDDWESHLAMALPFLEHGLPVFVDKPLSLEPGELGQLEPFLHAGKLMSCSGLRYARELDELREGRESAVLGSVRLVVATVLNGVERYGIHMLEAIASLGGLYTRPEEVACVAANPASFRITYGDGAAVLLLNCLGAVGKTFHLSFFGDREHRHYDLEDNFSAFRRTLEAFFGMVRSGAPPIPPDETLALVRLVAGASILPVGRIARRGTAGAWHVLTQN